MFLGDEIGEKFREAAYVGDLPLLTKLELQGVDLNSNNSMNGWTALHWACKKNHIAVVKYLLDRGADKNVKNKDGHIPALLTSNEEVRHLLGVPSDCEVGDGRAVYNPTVSSSIPDELVLKARLANSDEKDFIEIRLPHTQLNFAGLSSLICSELGVERRLVAKIRKLPDTIIRKDEDVKKLTDFQEVELVLTDNADRAASMPSDCEVKTSSLPSLPNYLASPAVPYINNDRDNQAHFPVNNMYYKASGGDGRAVYNPTVSSSIPDELVLKARLANSDEKDFIEVWLPHTQLNFTGLFSLMCSELGVDRSLEVKIRKLPDTIIRKDKDVKKLTDFQEVELVLTDNADSAASSFLSEMMGCMLDIFEFAGYVGVVAVGIKIMFNVFVK